MMMMVDKEFTAFQNGAPLPFRIGVDGEVVSLWAGNEMLSSYSLSTIQANRGYNWSVACGVVVPACEMFRVMRTAEGVLSNG